MHYNPERRAWRHRSYKMDHTKTIAKHKEDEADRVDREQDLAEDETMKSSEQSNG